MGEPKNEQMIFVLGMHRSGTSAFSGLLSILGFNLGKNLYPADPNINARGYWENADIVDVHERVLNSLGSSWSDDRNLPERWCMTPEMDAFRSELEAIVHRSFPAGSCWAVKDPRLCRLLPLWRQVIEMRRASAHCAVVLRDPREVARSLAIRDGIALERASLLWLQHFIEAERWSREYPRLIVAYDDLLKDWRSVVSATGKTFNISSLSPDIDTAAAIDEFLSDELRHHRSPPAPSGPIEALAFRVYEKCIASGGQAFEEEALHATRSIEEPLMSVAAWSTEIEMLRRNAVHLQGQKERAERLAREVDRVKETISWRITAPLRAMWNLPGSFARRLSFRSAPQRHQ
jgi:hypothetical protein